ncbi:DinB family protein [Alkalihalobacillus sp. TS-13]|uniref:DinB family protein n=1 Tax=Alkalihalobacillus sp. TS-13 TaxID=2842455 RepID=UPI001C87B765|nr:DinB family protein [Alkalihalobacillus sp. TS-13]
MSVFEEGRKELMATIDEIPEEQGQARISIDSWSVLEVLEHLVLIEHVITKQSEYLICHGEDTETPDHPVYRSAKRYPVVDAPEYVRPIGRYKSKDEAKVALQQSRNKLIQVLDEVEDPSLLEKRAFSHPIFGPMKLSQWIEFIGYHEKRHIDQIKEILKMHRPSA